MARKNSPSKRKNADFGVFCACRANFFAHKARQRGDLETDNTTARPQQGTAETDNTSAPENCAKNAHFSPAKAMAVSVEARSPPAKATGVSDNRPSWPTGPVCGAHGRRRGLARRPVGGQCYKRRQTNAIPITSREPLLQTSSSKPKTAIFSEKALGLTTFVTTGQKATRKTPWIDDVCNNTHPSTPKTQHARPP